MILLFDEKVTPTQLAKYLAWDMGSGAEYWAEDTSAFGEPTPAETKAVDKAVEKQRQRVRDFLRIHDIPGFD